MSVVSLRLPAEIKDLSMIAVVSVGVVLAFTASASVFDQFHQVAAEDLRGAEVTAVAGAGQTQQLNFSDWGVVIDLPLGGGMPMVKYEAEGPDAMGLSSVAAEKYGAVCSAGQNALGVVVREPVGANKGLSQLPMATSLGTVNGFSYAFEMPATPCTDTGAGSFIADEAMAIAGAAVLSAR